MAGGKLTPRQKMINLMYLVFIAMLAMNMSKEVLSAFGLMNEKFETANKSATETNQGMMQALDAKASEAGGEFAGAAATAHKVEVATKKFYDFLGGLKAEASKGTATEDATNYEIQDKADNLDNSLFVGEGYTPRGNAVIAAMEAYKTEMKAALGTEKKYSAILNQVNTAFNTADVKNKEGVSIKFLDYHFKGFPQIASVAKISAWQNDAKKAESDVISAALGKAAVQAASYSNYQAIVVLDKNAFFQGEQVTGKVVLGRYDENTKPAGITGPGRLDPATGQAKITMTAGGVGEQKFGGEFKFVEDGKPINLKYEGNYVVVPRPNSATISADKMNVVYRGLPNPMSISFAGIGDNNVNASAPGLTKAGNGKYNLKPGSGNEVTVSVTGKMADGKSVNDKKTFRIKNIPAPMGAIAGTTGNVKGQKSRLEVSQVSAVLPDFLYDLQFQVTQFAFKVQGQPVVIVNGDRVNAQCKAALAKAGRGDQVVISDIKTRIIGVDANVIPGKTAPVVYEIQ